MADISNNKQVKTKQLFCFYFISFSLMLLMKIYYNDIYYLYDCIPYFSHLE